VRYPREQVADFAKSFLGVVLVDEAYADFQNAKDRTDACILALKNEPPECKARVLEAMVRIAAASKENDNEDAISPEERNFIEEVQSRLAE